MRFVDQAVQRNVNFDLAILDAYAEELKKLEYYLESKAKKHQPNYYAQLRTIPGIGLILAMTILYEIGDINWFESVQISRFIVGSLSAKLNRLTKPMAPVAIKLAMVT